MAIETTERPIGFGRLKRKEDARFIRGQGNYLDDIKLPGMVYGALLRSPYAHAKIVSIDTSRALAHPNVAAVVTAPSQTLTPMLPSSRTASIGERPRASRSR